MGCVVNMVRNSVEAGGRDRFECKDTTWELMLTIGKAFGWKPYGTSYAPIDRDGGAPNSALHDYLPGDSRDRKYVDADDAKAWAAALSLARESPQLAAMLDARPELNANRVAESTARIDEFIEYVFGGAFDFARAD